MGGLLTWLKQLARRLAPKLEKAAERKVDDLLS